MKRLLFLALLLLPRLVWAACALDTASAFPLTTSNLQSLNAVSYSVSGVTTAANVMMVVAVGTRASGSTAYPLTISGAGLTWTKDEDQENSTGNEAAVLWHSFSASALSAQTITVTALASQTLFGVMAVYAFTGASSTIGSVAGTFGSTASTALSVTVNATAAGSCMVAVSDFDDPNAQTALANSTLDIALGDAVFASGAAFHLTSTTSGSGNVTYGSASSTSGNNDYAKAGVEILVAASSAVPTRSMLGVGQ